MALNTDVAGIAPGNGLRGRVLRSVAEIHKEALTIGDEAATNLFQTWTWFANLDEVGRPAELTSAFVLVENDNSQAPLCLPFALRERSPAAIYGPAIGALATYYSSLFGPICAEGDCTVERCRAAVQALRHVGQAADVIDLQPLDKDSRFYSNMITALRAEGYLVDSYFCFGNWHLPCTGLSFEQYYATLPSRVRNTVQRHRKKLEKHGSWSIDVHSTLGPAMDQAIEQFTRVYNRSWKEPEPFPDFVPGLCRSAAREGWLRLGVLQIGGTPAAAQLWLVRNRMAMIYKLAYDETMSQFSPGSVLSCEMFRRMLDDERVVDVDYLTGDDPYKQDWMRERRERLGILAFRRTSLRGLLSAGQHRIGQWLRSHLIPRRGAGNPQPEASGGV